MIAKATILFLFGTTLTSGLQSTSCLSGPEMAPLICKLMQPRMGYFKPQLIAPKKCDSPQLQMDIEMPAPVEEAKPLVIPQSPELPPMTIPKFPVPVIIEAPPAPLREPCESADIPVMPVVDIPTAPEMPPFEIHELPQIAAAPEPLFNEDGIPEIDDNTVEHHPISVSQPPELPAFVMPEIPIHVAELEALMLAPPCAEDEPIPAPIQAHVEPLVPLPAAPELPAYTIPKMPIQMIELPMHVTPSLENEPVTEHIDPLAPLPAAPELPASTMPELPIQIVELPMPVASGLEDEPIPAHVKPLGYLPAAPEIPAFTMPKLRIQINKSIQKVELPMPVVIPEIDDNTVEHHPISVSQPPELPAFVMPEIPIHVAELEAPMPAAPCAEDEPIPAPIQAHIEPLVPLPAAPELPASTMPKLPNQIVELPMPVAPGLEDEPIPAHAKPLAPLPAVQELPAFIMPKNAQMPIQINKSIQKEELPMPVVAPCLKDERIPEPIPADIEPLALLPVAPELPAFTKPECPIYVVEQESAMPATPFLKDEPIPFMPIQDYRQPEPKYNIVDYQPMTVPQLPELPAFEMQELPVYDPSHEDFPAPTVAVPDCSKPLSPMPAALVLPPASLAKFAVIAEPQPWHTEEKAAIEPISIPQSPKLPKIKMPEIPVRVATKEPIPFVGHLLNE